MTDFINSFIAELLTQISDLSFGDVVAAWIVYYMFSSLKDCFALKKRFDMQAEEAAQLEQFRFRAYNIAYSMVSEAVNGNPYVAQAIRDKIVNAYQRGESTL
ncbi:TPA: hypothetical protein I7566_05025 [Vibrio cholerae]|uniref:hypothetical protein n=1 Tax=Vibrio cholerae TaxID=666 RepID=UPI001185CC5F|nr:hypothetical protein [Vibrio cholerae]TVO07229.1 hypothetical protein FPX66_14885 [Vibrio cholerae]TVO41341.1 hypothetical protein FPX93_18825 [Vibrio cholerae]HAS7881610.1 hypothetical protein [Vibrio cholerae]HAS7885695.1 hypothetical protein [Vibrio cholerae]HAS7900861.1 hypothetical protein [Vibrio cholerae]